MFSGLYYLSTLIDKSFSLTMKEKEELFDYAKDNLHNVTKLIKIFEEDAEGFYYIKSNYKNSINSIGDKFKKDLKKGYKNKQIKELKDIKRKLINIKEIESKDKENIDIINLINNI